MDVSIIGSGYVGTTVAACFADLGHDVVNVDIDPAIVDAINAGQSPIHEPGLDDLLATYGGAELTATTDYADVRATDITFLALPTPPDRMAVSIHRSSRPQPKHWARRSPTRRAPTWS